MAKEEMTAKEFMQRYQSAKRRRKVIMNQLMELRLSEMLPSVKENDGMPHARNTETDLSGYAVRLEKLEQKLVKAEKDCIRWMDETVKLINRLEKEEHKELLTLRYVTGCRWEEIAKQMALTERRIFQLHGEALNEAKKTMPKRLH